MNLYEIDKQILDCIDAETGEIIDANKLSELAIERDIKIENVALWIKNLSADEAAFKAEKDSFAEREKSAHIKVEGLKNWLSKVLENSKFVTSKVQVTFRKSVSVEVDESTLNKEWCNEIITYKPDKRKIKSAIESGTNISGATLIEKQNIQIK